VSSSDAFEQESELPPAGSRSGCGVQSVMPYLTRTLQARPVSAPEPREARSPEGQPACADRPGWSA
jgi:hypothetical protein